MKQAYLIQQGVEEFALAREQFAVIVAQLQSRPVLGMEHGEVEKLVSREGTELLRRLVQAHFDLCTVREKREAGVRGADGVHAKPGTTGMSKAAGEFVRGGRGQAMWVQCPPTAYIEVDAAGQAPRYVGLLAFGGKVVIYGSNAPQIPPPLAR